MIAAESNSNVAGRYSRVSIDGGRDVNFTSRGAERPMDAPGDRLLSC